MTVRQTAAPRKRLDKHQIHKLGDFGFATPPACFHCEKELPPNTPVTIEGRGWMVAHCPSCRCMTPFKIARRTV
jgi:hypothetical protein